MSAPIIITVPNSYLVEDADSEYSDAVEVSRPVSRKRRLDHLTWEEKMQRKKLKNRVAAQTSRDRKKARMDDMEDNIKQLMAANERLSGEMASLRALNERLISENEELRSAAARPVAAGAGPAESPPRRKEAPAPASRAALLLMTLAQICSRISAPTNTSTRFVNSQTLYSKRLMQVLQERYKMSQSGTLESALKELKWWGPQQSTWNPVKV